MGSELNWEIIPILLCGFYLVMKIPTSFFHEYNEWVSNHHGVNIQISFGLTVLATAPALAYAFVDQEVGFIGIVFCLIATCLLLAVALDIFKFTRNRANTGRTKTDIEPDRFYAPILPLRWTPFGLCARYLETA